MFHSESSLSTATAHPSFLGSSRPFYLDTPKSDYYRSTASSICSESSYLPQSDSEDPEHLNTATDLQSIIATVPEPQLRATILKLAGRSTQFRNAIAKELEPHSPSQTATKSQEGSRKFLQSNTSCPPISICSKCGQVFNDGDTGDTCHYHTGELEDELFEFMSKTPEGRIFKVLKTISMWSCCEEEPGSIGCVSSPVHVEADEVD
ncbi:hypothetical protein J3R30DRAFT_3469852 [Lentinula aciculospora]|uniref:C2H2-type domain-containing protein n=1 Tax=Lentinula aciculospora TaxID=153920 RepID=A0A9W9DPQ6_9AGAR|nr:hypothetical protein J3R30DRAFT_3469852 [Lentinula aciculospora]